MDICTIPAVLCGRRDSNPHALRHQILSLARLPIPPRPLKQGAKVIFFLKYGKLFPLNNRPSVFIMKFFRQILNDLSPHKIYKFMFGKKS